MLFLRENGERKSKSLGGTHTLGVALAIFLSVSLPSASLSEVPSAPASVKALRPLRGAQICATLTDVSAPGEALA